jgi:hypothetical protein
MVEEQGNGKSGDLRDFFGKIRPQIFLALVILGVLGGYGIHIGLGDIGVGCIALRKSDVFVRTSGTIIVNMIRRRLKRLFIR